MVNRLGKSQLEHLSLQTTLHEILMSFVFRKLILGETQV